MSPSAPSPSRVDNSPPPATTLTQTTHWVTTPDGWRLHLSRLRMEGAHHGEPILLVHGLAAHAIVWNYREGRGLGPYLARWGYDVWMLDLRGHGLSSPTAREGGQWILEDFVDIDLPTAIAHILKDARAPSLKLVAHSMGALVTLLSVGRNPSLSDCISNILALMPSYPIDPRNPLWVRFFFKIILPGPGMWLSRLFGYSPYRVVFQTFENESITFSEQLTSWSRQKPWRSTIDDKDHFEAIANARAPIHFICSNGDRLWGRKEAVESLYKLNRSDKKSLIVIDEHLLLQVPIGHYQMILGDLAHEKLFPLYRQLLNE